MIEGDEIFTGWQPASCLFPCNLVHFVQSIPSLKRFLAADRSPSARRPEIRRTRQPMIASDLLNFSDGRQPARRQISRQVMVSFSIVLCMETLRDLSRRKIVTGRQVRKEKEKESQEKNSAWHTREKYREKDGKV